MEARLVNTQPLREMNSKARRALVGSGLWIRMGFIGACGVAAGIIQLLGGEVRPISALALAVGGTALATLSWRRAGAVLDGADKPASAVPSTGRDHALAGA